MTNFTAKYLNEKSDFDVAFESWMKGAQKICDDDQKKHDNSFAYGQTLTFKNNKKYIRIVTNRHGNDNKPMKDASVFAFINKSNGDVLKPAGFKVPAKGARGNIFDDQNGLGRISSYGPGYNR